MIYQVKLSDGTQVWRQDGWLHRLDGPAWVDADGRQEWYQNGERHRLDGPAVIWPGIKQEWWQNGEEITAEVEEWIDKHNIKLPLSERDVLLFQLRFCEGRT